MSIGKNVRSPSNEHLYSPVAEIHYTISIWESDDSYHAIVPWNLTICTTAREGLGARLVIG